MKEQLYIGQVTWLLSSQNEMAFMSVILFSIKRYVSLNPSIKFVKQYFLIVFWALEYH